MFEIASFFQPSLVDVLLALELSTCSRRNPRSILLVSPVDDSKSNIVYRSASVEKRSNAARSAFTLRYIEDNESGRLP